MAAIDRPFTGWGCGFFDYDNDGKLDLITGAQIHLNDGTGNFSPVPGAGWGLGKTTSQFVPMDADEFPDLVVSSEAFSEIAVMRVWRSNGQRPFDRPEV